MKTIIMVFMLAASLPALCQDEKSAMFMPSMTHGIGASFQKFDGLNSRIAAFPQYKKLRDHAAVLQLGWFKERKRFISTLDLTAGSSMSGDRDEKSSTIRFLGVSTDIGYDVIKSENISLYPLVGLGLETYQARFYKDNRNVSFDDVANSPATQNAIRPLDFRNNFFNYRLGAGVKFKSPKHPAHSIGLQGGYTGSFKERAWKSSENQQLLNAPEDRLSRFYVSLIFGYQPKFRRSM